MKSNAAGLVVVIGYGAAGTGAATTATHVRPDRSLVVVDIRTEAVHKAERAGFVGIHGDATRTATLEQARVPDADEVLVAAGPDSAAICVTGRVREFSSRCAIVTMVRETDHASVAHRAGADRVVVSSAAAGSRLARAVEQHATVPSTEAFLLGEQGVQLDQRAPTREEVGRPVTACEPPILAVVRDGMRLWPTDPQVGVIHGEDLLIVWRAGPTPR